MFDKFFKTIITILLSTVVFILWLGLDAQEKGYNNPNIVSIDYECNKLDEYQNVPKEVIEECNKRIKNGK